LAISDLRKQSLRYFIFEMVLSYKSYKLLNC